MEGIKEENKYQSINITTPEIGDAVKWQYTHHLNSKSSTERVKKGILLKITYPKKKYLVDFVLPIGIVKFEGNKTTSRLPLHTLTKINTYK